MERHFRFLSGTLLWLALPALLAWASAQQPGIPWGDAPLLWLNALRIAEDLPGSLGMWLGFSTPQPPLGYLPLILGTLVAADHAPLFASSLVFVATGLLLPARAWPLALVLGASPLVGRAFAEYGWDLPATLLVVYTTHALFSGARHAGLWVGACLLTKYSTAFFLVYPVLWALKDTRPPERLRLLGAVLVPLTPYLLFQLPQLAPYILGSLNEDVSTITLNGRTWAERLSVGGLLYYPLAIKDALSWPGIILLGVGWYHTPDRKPLHSALVGTLLLSLLPAALDRYAMPAVGLLAWGAMGLLRVPSGGLLIGAVFGIQLLGTTKSLRDPPLPVPSYDRPLSTLIALSWPQSPSYARAHVGLEAPQLALSDLQRVLPPGPLPVALYLPFDGRLPDTGVFAWLLKKSGSPVELRPTRPPAGQLPSQPIDAEVRYLLYVALDDAGLAWCEGQGFVTVQARKVGAQQLQVMKRLGTP